ncbi:MAG: hypothetical protein KA099_12005 [Alphaproteobacteria bacterium]|nr:hypothetical protein [Alphaproteobacteria bacterium]MBP7759970.1 hypothetical protein [Alphaproteobacteria bacterium]MBP7763324.1 hypothetical protein [Alphaproteobacteria bacterium]MBP7906035.1 hypothetical protein [Alphaproteobacteria bacterium]
MRSTTGNMNNRVTRALLLGAFAAVFCSGLFSMPAIAEGERDEAGQLAPGAKMTDEERRIAIEQQKLPYPDLAFCSKQLKDETLYRGGDRVMRVIYPGKNGWLFRSLDFRTDFTMSDPILVYMKRLNETLKKRGIDLYVMLQPPRAVLATDHIDPKEMPEGYSASEGQRGYQALVSKLQSLGVNIKDLSNPPGDFEYFFKGDPHWRREGSKWTADQMAEMILKNPLFKDKKKEEFSNEITWWLESEKGEFDEFVEKICKVIIPPERRPMWATTALSDVTDASALFGDVTYPDIAIVGTSNTAHEEDFNFVGSLKLALKSDIRNRALSAGGFGGAGVVFFASDEFQDHPPKILIWEFLSHHTFEDAPAFRQMLPALNGACKTEEAVVSAELDFKAPAPPQAPVDPAAIPVAVPVDPATGQPVPAVTTEAVAVKPAPLAEYGPFLPTKRKPKNTAPMKEIRFFEALDTQNIMAKGHYLYLEVTAPESRLVKIGVLYDNGEAEEIDVSRSLRAQNNGKYYLEFDQNYPGKVIMVQAATDKPDGHLKAQICKYSDASL